MSEEIDKDEDEGNFTDVSEATTVLCHNHIETECDTDVRSSEDELMYVLKITFSALYLIGNYLQPHRGNFEQ